MAGVLTAIALIGAAWTTGSGLVARSFIATDDEVEVVNKRVERHEKKVDPQLIKFAGSIEVLTFNSLRFQISQKDQQLYEVRQRLPNPDAKSRELQLVREIEELLIDKRRAECAVARANSPQALC